MTEFIDSRVPSEAAADLAGRVKLRIRMLFFAGMIAVALVFGLTFYFALVSNQSALARQVPELEAVAAKLKSMLIVSTLAVVAIIIASFVALGSIVTSRLFQSLAVLHRDLVALGGPKLPRGAESRHGGPFSPLTDSLASAISALRERERKEIATLARCAAALEGQPASRETARALGELAAAKAAFAGTGDASRGAEGTAAEKDQLFIQPL